MAFPELQPKPKDYNVGPAAAVTLVWLPIGLAFSGYVTSTLWNWFVAPFMGWPTMGLLVAVGIDIFIGSVRYRYREEKGEPNKLQYIGKRIWDAVLTNLVFLGLGWIVHSLMR
jgi:hypothetical protein